MQDHKAQSGGNDETLQRQIQWGHLVIGALHFLRRCLGKEDLMSLFYTINEQQLYRNNSLALDPFSPEELSPPITD